MILYPQKALRALAYLFRPYNDIDIYVEDTTSHAMYLVLFTRMLNGKAKITHVFQMPGREAIIQACQDFQQASSGRRSLYIIDGDFDALLNQRPYADLQNLYQLKVFCSENLVFTASAVNEIAFECLAHCSREKAISIVQFTEFKRQMVKRLSPLFIMYTVAYTLNKDIPTVDFNVTRLLETSSGSGHKLSDQMIKARIQDIRNQLLRSCSTKELDEKIKFVRRRLPTRDDNMVKLICGKRYIMPLLIRYLQSKVRYRGTIEQLKVRLARYCDLKIDTDLLSAVEQTSRTQTG